MMRVICLLKILTIIVLSFFVLSSKGQVYQSMPQYGYSGPRFNMDSTLSIPTVCGTPTLKSNLIKKAAIAFDSCNGVFYQYNPKTLAWSQITGGGGVSTAVDTIYRTIGKDSIQFTIGSRYYAIKDSTSGVATRLVTTVYNNSGSTISKGSVIYINGRHSSNYPTVALAQANTEANSYSTFAMVQDDILNNNTGTVIQAGNISNLNLPTSTYTDGQLVYLSPTVAGGITTTKSLAPNHIVKIGTITRAHPTLGSIELKIENGWQLDELSDVKIAVVPADSTILQFSRVDSLWHDVNPTTAMGNRFVKVSDSSAMLSKYLRKTDTTNKFINTITRIPGKDSIIFYIGNIRYAIKDSLGSGASPGGNSKEIQYNNSIFSGAYGFRYDTDDKTVEISNTESYNAISRLDVHDGYQGDLYRNVIANFSKNGDANIGIYNSSNYSNGGSSLMLGNSQNLNANETYPTFQIKNVNDSLSSTGYITNNYIERNSSGDIFHANNNLLKINSNGSIVLNSSLQGIGTAPQSKLGIGTSSPIGKEHINYSTSDYTNTNGENTHLFLSNPSATGQTSIYSEINGNPVAKWRTDFVGNINWVAYEGNQYFWTGGDYPDGTYKMILWNDGNVGIGEWISNGGYRFQVNGDSYFYNTNSVNVCTIESGSGYAIQILTVDEPLNNDYYGTKGSIGNSPNGLYENQDGNKKWRKITRPYRSYVAQLTQWGTNAPVANILENDLGYEPTWSRASAGDYRLSSTELLYENANKVVIFLTIGTPYGNPMELGYSAHAYWNIEENYAGIITAYNNGSSEGTGVSDNLLSDGAGDDFFRASIEIRIYD